MEKDWRISEEEFAVFKARMLERGITPEEWSDWSLKEHPMKEIMARAIMTAQETGQRQRSWMCLTYVLESNKFTQEQLEDLMFIFSGLFSFKAWTDESVRWVIEMFERFGCSNIYWEAIDASKDETVPEALRENIRKAIRDLFDAQTATMQNGFKKGIVAFEKPHITKVARQIREALDIEYEYEVGLLDENSTFEAVEDNEALTQKYIDDYARLLRDKLAELFSTHKKAPRSFKLIDRINWAVVCEHQRATISKEFVLSMGLINGLMEWQVDKYYGGDNYDELSESDDDCE